MTLLAYIPARLGSERVKAKNLRLLAGKPLVSYAIGTVLQSKLIDRAFLNTEADEIAEVGARAGIEVYRRPAHLASSTACTDEIVADFLENNACDAVAVINPTAPLLTAATIDAAIARFRDSQCDGLFSCNSLRKHSMFKGEPLNFSKNALSPRTQDLEPVRYINFLICIFRAKTALENFHAHGNFLYRGQLEFVDTPDEESIDIDYDVEFRMMEAMMNDSPPIAYHRSDL